MKSQFKEKIDKMLQQDEKPYVLRGDALLIEVLDDEEFQTEGGIIIASDPRQLTGGVANSKSQIGIVLDVGEGYYDEDGSAVPLDIRPGAIVLLPRNGILTFSTFPGLGLTNEKIGMVTDSSVRFFYPSISELKRAEAICSH